MYMASLLKYILPRLRAQYMSNICLILGPPKLSCSSLALLLTYLFYAQRAEHDEVSLDEPVEVQRATRGRQKEEIWIILTLKRLVK